MASSDRQQQTYAQLQQLARTLVPDCPDMRQMARETALTILAKYGHPYLDPDQVYLNRFDTAQSNPHTFSGWAHHDAPVQSFTLPQLVMHRFDVNDQDNADLLSYRTGFYSEGSGASVFDERNEIPIAPSDVLTDFWAIDFSTQFQQRVETFWQQHADTYRTLAKVHFLGAVLEACEADASSELARRALQVARALVGPVSWPPTLAQLHQEVTPGPEYRLCSFDIGGHLASDILRVRMQDGYQLLYIPGEVEPLQLFATERDLYWWVLNTSNHADNRSRFMSHFPLATQADKHDSVGLNHMLDLLFYNWGSERHACLNQLDSAIATDAFNTLRDNARQRMFDDAHIALQSNAQLRKQLWIGYLSAFSQLVSPMSTVDWPIALAVVGAGLGQVGLHIDQAITGRTTAERQAGVIAAVIGAIATLFDAVALAALLKTAGQEVQTPGAGENTPLEPEDDIGPATPSEIQTWVPAGARQTERSALLEPFMANIIIEEETGSGKLANIYTQAGDLYVLIDQAPYQVRWVEQMRSWIIVDPGNPYSFYRNVPIRFEGGQWHPYPRPGLRGGMLARKWLNLWGRTAPNPALPELPPSPYEIPVESRTALRSAALSGDLHALSGSHVDLSPGAEAAFETFRRLRDKLAAEASGYLATHAPRARPTLPELLPQASPKQIIRAVYAQTDGLVIGESHSQLGSKRFLIDNMAQLSKARVKVLYLEHFMTEFNQADLDAFNRTGQMPANLRTYVQAQDFGHATDAGGRYTFENVLTSAREHRIRLQAIDCLASYQQAWSDLPPSHARQKMMNYFAHLIIEADQANRGPAKWVALVGNTHSNTFEGVAGISELQGAIGLRIEDIPVDQVGGIGIDPGLTVIESDLSMQSVRGDLRLQVPITHDELPAHDLATSLRNTGDFTFQSVKGQANLIHRGHDGTLKYTPIWQQGGRLRINKPDWPWVSARSLRDLAELRATLTRAGLRYRRT